MKYIISLILISLYYCKEICKLIQDYPVNVKKNKIIIIYFNNIAFSKSKKML